MTPTDDLLTELGKTHGAFADHARVTQRLKRVLDDELYTCKNAEIQNGGRANIVKDEALNAVMMESVEMILHKIGRIVAGDPTEKDHWDDIAGYARLVSQQL